MKLSKAGRNLGLGLSLLATNPSCTVDPMDRFKQAAQSGEFANEPCSEDAELIRRCIRDAALNLRAEDCGRAAFLYGAAHAFFHTLTGKGEELGSKKLRLHSATDICFDESIERDLAARIRNIRTRLRNQCFSKPSSSQTGG